MPVLQWNIILNVQEAKTERTASKNRYRIIVRNFNSCLPVLNGTNGQRISKDRGDLDDTINQFVLIDIYRSHNAMTAENTFFSSSHGT